MFTRHFYRTLSVFLGLGLVVLLALPAGPVEQRSRQVDRRAPVAGRSVRLISRSAQVTVRPAATDELTATARLRLESRDQRWLAAAAQSFDLELRERGDVLELGFPKDWDDDSPGRIRFFHFDFDQSYDLDLELLVPKGTALELENRYGDVLVSGIEGELEVRLESGQLSIREAGGPVTIASRYAAVEVEGVAGALRIENQSGGVKVSGLSGAALVTRHEISSQYGSIELAWPATATPPALDLRTQYGSIDCALAGSRGEQDGYTTFTAAAELASEAVLSLDASSGDVVIRRQ